jgi:hypothetical protein
MNDVFLSIRRTLVPVIVGFLLAQAARWQFDIDPDQLTGLLEALITGIYYSLVRLAEARWPGRNVGVLIGAATPPTYQP